MAKNKKCCICGKTFEGIGHNPDPVKTSGRCCVECNATKVIKARYEVAKNLNLQQQ